MYGEPRDLHVLTHSFPTLRSSDLRRSSPRRPRPTRLRPTPKAEAEGRSRASRRAASGSAGCVRFRTKPPAPAANGRPSGNFLDLEFNADGAHFVERPTRFLAYDPAFDFPRGKADSVAHQQRHPCPRVPPQLDPPAPPGLESGTHRMERQETPFH